MNTVSCRKVTGEIKVWGDRMHNMKHFFSVLFNDFLNCWAFVGVGDI
jgi:hypothetical protein